MTEQIPMVEPPTEPTRHLRNALFSYSWAAITEGHNEVEFAVGAEWYAQDLALAAAATNERRDMNVKRFEEATPGPWMVWPGDSDRVGLRPVRICDSDDRVIAEVLPPESGSIEEHNARINLVKTAPRLLAEREEARLALRDAALTLHFCEGWVRTGGQRETAAETRAKIKALLARMEAE